MSAAVLRLLRLFPQLLNSSVHSLFRSSFYSLSRSSPHNFFHSLFRSLCCSFLRSKFCCFEMGKTRNNLFFNLCNMMNVFVRNLGFQNFWMRTIKNSYDGENCSYQFFFIFQRPPKNNINQTCSCSKLMDDCKLFYGHFFLRVKFF